MIEGHHAQYSSLWTYAKQGEHPHQSHKARDPFLEGLIRLSKVYIQWINIYKVFQSVLKHPQTVSDSVNA